MNPSIGYANILDPDGTIPILDKCLFSEQAEPYADFGRGKLNGISFP
jgi:hypothetical protein